MVQSIRVCVTYQVLQQDPSLLAQFFLSIRQINKYMDYVILYYAIRYYSNTVLVPVHYCKIYSTFYLQCRNQRKKRKQGKTKVQNRETERERCA